MGVGAGAGFAIDSVGTGAGFAIDSVGTGAGAVKVLSAAAGFGFSSFLLGQPSANTSATIAQAAISFFTKSSFFSFSLTTG